MPDIQESLDAALSIKGARGVAMVDIESGMTLGTAGSAEFDLEHAAAGNADFVKTKLSLAEDLGIKDDLRDIVISFDHEVHLIRMFTDNPRVFTYLVLDPKKGNLALARMQLEEIDADLVLA
jgi:hypothetical protein